MTEIDLAGFNPLQPRDMIGRWRNRGGPTLEARRQSARSIAHTQRAEARATARRGHLDAYGKAVGASNRVTAEMAKAAMERARNMPDPMWFNPDGSPKTPKNYTREQMQFFGSTGFSHEDDDMSIDLARPRAARRRKAIAVAGRRVAAKPAKPAANAVVKTAVHRPTDGVRPAATKPKAAVAHRPGPDRQPANGNARARLEIQRFKAGAGLKSTSGHLGKAAMTALKSRAAKPGHLRAKAILAASRGNVKRANKIEAVRKVVHKARVAQASLGGKTAVRPAHNAVKTVPRPKGMKRAKGPRWSK